MLELIDEGDHPERPAIIRTHTGQNVDLLDPKSRDIDMIDIAWHLSGIVRYNGASFRRISVAEHTMMIIEAMTVAGLKTRMQQLALLHDAHEAYLGDVVGPLKAVAGFERLKELEDRFDRVIHDRFNVPIPTPKERAMLDMFDKGVRRVEFSAAMTGALPYMEYYVEARVKPAEVEPKREVMFRLFTDMANRLGVI